MICLNTIFIHFITVAIFYKNVWKYVCWIIIFKDYLYHHYYYNIIIIIIVANNCQWNTNVVSLNCIIFLEPSIYMEENVRDLIKHWYSKCGFIFFLGNKIITYEVRFWNWNITAMNNPSCIMSRVNVAWGLWCQSKKSIVFFMSIFSTTSNDRP